MKYLGIDWGLKRIGLAISEGELAQPLQTIEVRSLKEALAKIEEVVKKEGIEILVIGKPESGQSLKLVENAVKELKKIGVQIEEVEETLSTQKARRYMIEIGTTRKERREDNAVSAAIILQSFLDQRR